MGYLDAREGAHSRTAFRTAEKLYKRYKQSSTQLRTSKSRKKVPPTDLSEVLDFRKLTEFLGDSSFKLDGVSRVIGNPIDKPVFVLDGHPGFYFIPEALSTEEQCYWIQQSLTSFPQPPGRTNHNAVYGPIHDLWSNAQAEQVLIEVAGEVHRLEPHPQKSEGELQSAVVSVLSCESARISDQSEIKNRSGQFQLSTSDSETLQAKSKHEISSLRSINENLKEDGKSWQFVDASKVMSSLKTITAKSLLRKLRWSTIGLQFDWSKKAYDASLSNEELMPELSELAERLAKPAISGGKFLAESAIVNYYGPDDMLGGHVDDMETDWSKPIVSISLGCKAVFLLGGTSRDDKPVAMYLRSGDVVLMAGPARRCFHGVPRIFAEMTDSDLPDFSILENGSMGPFMDYISQSRINVNVRQVN